MLPSLNARYLEILISLLGTPYLWHAKGEERGIIETAPSGAKTLRLEPVPEIIAGEPGFALDCSGGVTYAAWRAGGPDHRWSHHTDRLWAERPRVVSPRPGDLAFYGGRGPTDVDHVMTVLACLPGGEVFVLGPSGGDSSTRTLARAKEQHARLKLRTSHLYRRDFRGFRAGYFNPAT